MAMPEMNHCRNCGSQLTGSYCSECGQRDIDFKKDWKGLSEEYASSLFNFDGKVPRGILDLLFRPGRISKHYLEGKRASQIPPLRLYLFASLIFFIWVTYNPSSLPIAGTVTNKKVTSGEVSPTTGDVELDLLLSENFENPEALIENFYNWLPRVSLLGVPILALVTRILFRKRGLVLLEHLVVAMHLLTFYHLWTLLTQLIAFLVGIAWSLGGTIAEEVIKLWIFIYPVFALRTIFSLSWWKAIGSALLLESIFIIMLLATVGAAGGIAYWIS